MNKKIFTQIKNEWKSNLWLFMELFLVSVVMWYIADFMYVRLSLYNEPKGFDISHCYYIRTSALTSKSSQYDPKDSIPSSHYDELCRRLEHDPAIEAVGLSSTSYPYDGTCTAAALEYDTIKVDWRVYTRAVTPGFLKVFRYYGMNGESPEKLASLLSDNNLFIADDAFKDKIKGGVSAIVGKEVSWAQKPNELLKVAASLKPIKYSEFIESYAMPSLVCRLPNDWRWVGLEVCVRVRPEYDKDFANKLLNDSPKKYNIGNLYVSNVKSFEDIRLNYISHDLSKLRMVMWVMTFLLVNIFLGLFGTFWFRTQQRKGEIALLKSFGSNNKGIYYRFILEGLVILTIATIPAIIVDYNLAHAEITEMYKEVTLETGRIIFAIVSSFLSIFIMMALGISIPARKAMKIDPAETLHEE